MSSSERDARAVADEAGQPEGPEWEPVEGLAAWVRELGVEDFEAEPAIVGAESGGWT